MALYTYLSQGGLHPSCGSSIRCEGNKRGRPRRNSLSDKSLNEAGKLKDQISSGGTSKSSSPEEIIALFRRIQSSISNREPKVSNKRNPSNRKDSKEKQSAESVLATLRKYPTRKQVRAPNQEESRIPPESQGTSEDKTLGDASPSGDFEVSRPMSNFVKRSPIPSEENIREVVETPLPTVVADEGLELQGINKMKLSELKELAKTKGVKGYSKLKKGELLELLRGLYQSSS